MNKRFIVRFRFEHLRNEVHVEYNGTIDGLIVNHNPQALGIWRQYENYKCALVLETGLLDIIRKSEYTDEISDTDRKRNKTYRGAFDSVKSSLNHFNYDKRKAAERLNIVFVHYGNIAGKTFDEESAAIEDLLRELNDNHADDVQLLELNDWLTQLGLENQEFKQLMLKRYSETAKRPTTRMVTARSETDKALRSLFNMVEALAMVNGVDAYLPFISELNAVNERYKNQLAQSSGRKMKTKDSAQN
ncbi:MAG: DUF6261 family protein [Prevotellaceae bacterium]|nr:DUF6261 family protein [Prevotellaceae bacterium]